MKLSVNNLSYSSGKTPLLSDISFSVQKQERIALIGPNGSGKSTLLRLICGLNKPNKGEILLNESRIQNYSRRALAQRLTFVQQKSSTEERICAEDAVALGRIPWLKPFEKWDERHQHYVTNALQEVDMLSKRAQNWHTLSGGEQQRLHIARALAQNTPFIVMDEPTNHLDIKHQVVVLSLIEKIQRTMLVAVHDLNHALHFDRVIAIKEGKMVANGPPQEVITSDFIQHTFGVQSRIIRDSSFPTHIQLLSDGTFHA